MVRSRVNPHSRSPYNSRLQLTPGLRAGAAEPPIRYTELRGGMTLGRGCWRRFLFAGAAIIMLATSCNGGDPVATNAIPTPTLTSAPLPEPSRADEVEMGVPYIHELFVHCGASGTRFAGRDWDADPPVGDHNPPRGWEENRETGTMTLLSEDRAEFRSATDGRTVQFKPRPPGGPDPNAECE
jgi:hypothetical protein